MNSTIFIEAELASVRRELEEVLPHVSDDLLPWAPADGMRTIHGQFVELLSTEERLLSFILESDRRPFVEIEQAYWALTTISELTDAMDLLRQRTLKALIEVDLKKTANVSASFSNWLMLEEVPKSELFRYIARHESYHTGQLFSYLWTRGNNPYDWD